jgi:hypothetical protein
LNDDIPQDLSTESFSVKVRIGVSDNLSLRPGRKYQFRISSYAKNGKDYLFYRFGIPTKVFTAKLPTGKNKRKSFINKTKNKDKKKLLKHVQSIASTSLEKNKSRSISKKNKATNNLNNSPSPIQNKGGGLRSSSAPSNRKSAFGMLFGGKIELENKIEQKRGDDGLSNKRRGKRFSLPRMLTSKKSRRSTASSRPSSRLSMLQRQTAKSKEDKNVNEQIELVTTISSSSMMASEKDEK